MQAQPAHQEHGDERAVLRDELAKAAALVRAENFPARVGQHCRDCAFVAICPAKSAGSVTVG
ncbi:MAG: PD-(D/E)XK nuclease family protein [Nocardioides sp.]